MSAQPSDRTAFESAIRGLEADIANAGAHLTIDSAARQAYSRQIKLMADELRLQAGQGALTWREAAEKANDARNTVMNVIRQRSTPVGRAYAEYLKKEGKTLNQMIALKTKALFGEAANFNHLTAAQQNQVYAEVVSSAAKSRPSVNAQMKRLSRAGRGLVFLSIGLSIYTVATADDKMGAAAREGAVTGAGIGGGIAGGALAGLACGPGAPVCVTVGAFVGGALAAFGVDYFW
ncbi:MAG: hypothetical protein EOP50_11830 [Sphingobacteriales bacterium]|nr:MAG: hypothetical protein EOP50_11830 [Sphingobacteriales bacterium]